MVLIYKMTNAVNGKVYVGQSTNLKQRTSKHLRACTGPHISAAIKKHGSANFVVAIIEDDLTDDQANEREQYWIAFYNSADRAYGYNLTYGGHGTRATPETRAKMSASLKGKRPTMLGRHHTAESKSKMSAAATGRVPTLEHRQKQSLALKGRVFSQEHRAKISAGKTGKPLSVATKAKLRAYRLGRPSPIRGIPKTPEHVAHSVEAKTRNRILRKGAAQLCLFDAPAV